MKVILDVNDPVEIKPESEIELNTSEESIQLMNQ